MGQINSNKKEENTKSKNDKSVNVSLSQIKCKNCKKNYIPNKLIRSHLFYCVECYLKKKKFKYEADLNYHTKLDFNEIIPNKLYLGNNESAKNFEILKEHEITSILICGYFLSEFFPDKFIYKTLEFEDNKYEIIIFSLIKGIEFIEKNKTILVHCREGVCRSSTIVIAYIMFKEKKSFVEAESFVKSKKSNINPNENFVKQLKEFEDIIKVCKYDLKMIKEFCRNFTGNKFKQIIEIKE